MHKALLTEASAVALMSVSVLGSVAAHQQNPWNPPSEAPFVGQAAVTMGQAVAVAETEFGGKGATVGIEDRGGHAFFEITIRGRDTIRKILVDPRSGEVVNTVTATRQNENRRGNHG